MQAPDLIPAEAFLISHCRAGQPPHPFKVLYQVIDAGVQVGKAVGRRGANRLITEQVLQRLLGGQRIGPGVQADVLPGAAGRGS